MQCLSHTNLHPCPSVADGFHLLNELLLQDMLIHSLQGRQVEHAVSLVFESLARPEIIQEVGLSSLEHAMRERRWFLVCILADHGHQGSRGRPMGGGREGLRRIDDICGAEGLPRAAVGCWRIRWDWRWVVQHSSLNGTLGKDRHPCACGTCRRLLRIECWRRLSVADLGAVGNIIA